MATEQEVFDFDWSTHSLFVSTPMFGGMCTGLFFQSMLRLQKTCMDVNLKCAISSQWNQSLITRARNYEADRFRASGMTHHLFVDADQGFEPADILQMLMADKDVVCGPYAKKTVDWQRVIEAASLGYGAEQMQEVCCEMNLSAKGPMRLDGTPQEIRAGGTSLMMVRRKVYDDMQAAYPEIAYVPGKLDETPEYGDGGRYYAFFDTIIDPETHEYLAEDWSFCLRWERLGGKIYLLPWLRTSHVGTFMYMANGVATAELQARLAESKRKRPA